MNQQEIQAEEEAAARWAGCLDEVHARIAKRFARSEQRQRARAYLQGLLSPIERKNGWQLAEAAGEANPYGYQELLSRAQWDANTVRDDLLNLVREHLADPTTVMVIDETGFVKKGTKSVGVAPQYSGTVGKIGNCQIGVFLAYASPKGQVLMDREIYLPHEWTDDHKRGEEAGVPEEVEFATKIVLARRMLERALEHHLPCAWVTADCVYGDDYHLRRFLTEHSIPYVLAVHPQNQIRMGLYEGFASVRIDEWFARKHRGPWYRLSAGWGSKGPRWFDWAWRKMDGDVPEGWQAWVVVRRSISDPTEVVYQRVCAPRNRRPARAVCCTSSAREDWPFINPLHTSRGPSPGLVTGVATDASTCPDGGLVFVPPASSGGRSIVSLQTPFGSQYVLILVSGAKWLHKPLK